VYTAWGLKTESKKQLRYLEVWNVVSEVCQNTELKRYIAAFIFITIMKNRLITVLIPSQKHYRGILRD